MQEVKIENGTTSDSIIPREFNKKRTILRAKTMSRKRENRIVRKQSEEPFRRIVSFADKNNKPIHTVIDIVPFKYEAEYIKAVETSPGQMKKSQGCHCVIV